MYVLYTVLLGERKKSISKDIKKEELYLLDHLNLVP